MKSYKPTPKDIILCVLAVAFLACSLYMGIAWGVFQWRNPKANQMSYFRDFVSVVTWRRVPNYQ